MNVARLPQEERLLRLLQECCAAVAGVARQRGRGRGYLYIARAILRGCCSCCRSVAAVAAVAAVAPLRHIAHAHTHTHTHTHLDGPALEHERREVRDSILCTLLGCCIVACLCVWGGKGGGKLLRCQYLLFCTCKARRLSSKIWNTRAGRVLRPARVFQILLLNFF
jgi:hypothetical protein